VIFRRPPLAEPDRLVHLYSSSPHGAFDPLSYPDLADLSRGTKETFSGIATSRPRNSCPVPLLRNTPSGVKWATNPSTSTRSAIAYPSLTTFSLAVMFVFMARDGNGSRASRD